MFVRQKVSATALELPSFVQFLSGSAAPTDGTAGTGAGHAGPGSSYFSTTTKSLYLNQGTKASPLWVLQWGYSYAAVTLTKANILAMFAAPVTVVAAPGAGYALEFAEAVLINDFSGLAYGGGGAVSLAYGSSGATLTETIAAANSFGASGDKVYRFGRLDPSGGISMPVNTPIVITNASAAFNDTTGSTSATGVIGSGGNGTVTTTVTAVGTAGNSYTIQVVLGVGLNVALSAAVVGTAITVTLGTDGAGATDATKNTATLVAAAVDAIAAITSVASGTGATALTLAEGPTTFTGGAAGTAVGIGRLKVTYRIVPTGL